MLRIIKTLAIAVAALGFAALAPADALAGGYGYHGHRSHYGHGSWHHRHYHHDKYKFNYQSRRYDDDKRYGKQTPDDGQKSGYGSKPGSDKKNEYGQKPGSDKKNEYGQKPGSSPEGQPNSGDEPQSPPADKSAAKPAGGADKGETCDRLLDDGCYFAKRKFSTPRGDVLRCTKICDKDEDDEKDKGS